MIEIALCGNPNTGKTTLFNALTGREERVGNWHGVTVGIAEGNFRHAGKTFKVYDLPGLYTLRGSSAEERIAESFLAEKKYALAVVVIDAKTAARGLRLADEIAMLGVPVCVFVNFVGELKKLGGTIDPEKAERVTGYSFFAGEAVKKNSVKAFREFLCEKVTQKKKDRETSCGQSGKRAEDLSFYVPPAAVSRADRLLLSPFLCLPLFVVSVLSIFYLSFGKYGIGSIVSERISRLTEFLSDRIFSREGAENSFSTRFLRDGIFNGISSVLMFLPQIAVLSVCVDFLDQCGFMSYLAVSADGLLRRFGFGGKAVYTLLSGFGCTALAAVSSGGIEDEGIRRRTVLSLPFLSCSARTPVYLYLASFLAKEKTALCLTAVYFLSVSFALLSGSLLRSVGKREKEIPLLTELASIRIPLPGTMLKSLRKTIKQFIIRLGSMIVALSVALWLLTNFSVRGEFLLDREIGKSILAAAGGKLSFLFRPIGLDDWRFGAAFFSGLFAKEGVVAAFVSLFPEGLSLSASQGAALLVFTWLYTPCFTALFAMKEKIGYVRTAVSAVGQFLIAVLFSFLVYRVFGLFV